MNDTKQKKIKVLASPKTRKFARELGVEVKDIEGSQRLGRVVEKDVKEFISRNINKKPTKKISDEFNKDYNHSDFGEVEIKDIPRIKKIAAPHLSNSWTTIPHVTNHDEADITDMEQFRNSLTDIYTGQKKKNYSFIIYN